MQNLKYKYTIIKKIFLLLKGMAVGFFLYFAVSLFLMGISYIEPRLYRMFIDNVLIKGRIESIWIVILGYCGVFLIGAVLKIVKEYFGYKVNGHVRLQSKEKLLSNYFKRDFDYYEKVSSADTLINLEEDTAFLNDFIETYIINYYVQFISLFTALILIFKLSYILALVALVTIPLTICLDKMVGLREKKVVEEGRKNDEQINSWFNNTLNNWREVKALSLEKRIRMQFLELMHKHIILNAQKIYFFVTRCIVIPWIREKFFMQIVIYFVGGLLSIYKGYSVGEILVFIMYYNLLSAAIKEISLANTQFLVKSSIIHRVLKQMEYQKREEYKRPADETGEISLKDVSFQYASGEAPVFQNISFTVEKGEKVLISGKNGEGKSTLVKLITGLLRPTQGIVSYSGIPVDRLDTEYLYEKIGFIMQGSLLFNLSIKENLLLAKGDATEEEIEAACKRAMIYDYIKGLHLQYDTMVGEAGATLSGGLKQRLILARQLLRKSEVLVFDEATSNLDQYTEDYIHKVLKEIGADRTIFYITHREVEAEWFDKIIKVENSMLEILSPAKMKAV